jgi:hypothetical protein
MATIITSSTFQKAGYRQLTSSGSSRNLLWSRHTDAPSGESLELPKGILSHRLVSMRVG